MAKKIIPYMLFVLSFFATAQQERKAETPNVSSQLTMDMGLSGVQLGYEFRTGWNSTLQMRGKAAAPGYAGRCVEINLNGDLRFCFQLAK